MAAGLNLQHIFNIADLPSAWQTALAPRAGERQLILLGHAGRRLWDCLQAAGIKGEDPIDDYTRTAVDACFARFLPGRSYRLCYPAGNGSFGVPLQALGERAGWHQASPFMVGIDRHWGSWFAYRAVIVLASHFCPSPAVDRKTHPCSDCPGQPCLAACPAGACSAPGSGTFNLSACSAERLTPGSSCALGCLARQACPLGSGHRYDDAQIRHSYSRSLQMLENHSAGDRLDAGQGQPATDDAVAHPQTE